MEVLGVWTMLCICETQSDFIGILNNFNRSNSSVSDFGKNRLHSCALRGDSRKNKK